MNAPSQPAFRLKPAIRALGAALALATVLGIGPAPAQAATPTVQEGKAYMASYSLSNATGTAFANLLHDQVVVTREGGQYWLGFASVNQASDKKIIGFSYGSPATAADTEKLDDNTRVFILPVASLDRPVQISVRQSSGTGTARVTVNTATLQPVPLDAQWQRLAGANALDTMAEVVKVGFAKSSYAILATNSGYWDALSASGLAGIYQCPIVLTQPKTLSTQASQRLKAMGAKNVIIVGGPAAVSNGVASQVRAMGCSVTRIGGANAVETSYKVWQHGKGKWGNDVITATKDGYWDALSIAPYAYKAKAPVLLHNNYGFKVHWHSGENHRQLSAAAAGNKRVIIAGGTKAVSGEVERLFPNSKRLSGANAYGTSAAVAEWCVQQGMSANKVGVATGSGYWDALVAGPFCGKNNAVMVLADDKHLGNISGFVLKHSSDIDEGYVFGGKMAVGELTLEACKIATSATGISAS